MRARLPGCKAGLGESGQPLTGKLDCTGKRLFEDRGEKGEVRAGGSRGPDVRGGVAGDADERFAAAKDIMSMPNAVSQPSEGEACWKMNAVHPAIAGDLRCAIDPGV